MNSNRWSSAEEKSEMEILLEAMVRRSMMDKLDTNKKEDAVLEEEEVKTRVQKLMDLDSNLSRLDRPKNFMKYTKTFQELSGFEIPPEVQIAVHRQGCLEYGCEDPNAQLPIGETSVKQQGTQDLPKES